MEGKISLAWSIAQASPGAVMSLTITLVYETTHTYLSEFIQYAIYIKVGNWNSRKMEQEWEKKTGAGLWERQMETCKSCCYSLGFSPVRFTEL